MLTEGYLKAGYEYVNIDVSKTFDQATISSEIRQNLFQIIHLSDRCRVNELTKFVYLNLIYFLYDLHCLIMASM